ncbi:MAG: NfeD family protein [Oscillospiraceae bacterium]|nr:NfeD family protein [Oscillospiraceae bacterium]
MEIAFWLILMCVLVIVEALSVQLVCVWFAFGSLAAFVAALLGAPVWAQAAVCVAVSAVLLCFTRPLARKYIQPKSVATNADRVLGQTGRVTEDIDNTAQTGAVYTLGKEWTARSSDGGRFETGATVTVERIEGVKLWVSAARESPRDAPEKPEAAAHRR